MDDHSHGSGHCEECQPAAPSTAAGAKRLLDSAGQAQAPQSPKKTCVSSHPYSTPDPPGTLLIHQGQRGTCSPGSASFQGCSPFLGGSSCDGPSDSPASNYDGDVAISLDTTRCFDDSEPDDSLLEPSGSDEENSPFDYAEEEIQKILADDCMESECDTTSTSALSQSGDGESDEGEGSSCSGASVTSEDASVASDMTERPKKALSRESSPLSTECYPSLLSDSAWGEEDSPQAAPMPCVMFDLDIQELLILSPFDPDCQEESLEECSLEEAGGEASEAIRSDCPQFDATAKSSVLKESLEGLMAKGQQSLGEDCLAKTPFASQDMSSLCGDHVGRSTPSSGPACGQHSPAGSSALVFPRCPTPSSRSGQRELRREEKSWFSRRLSSPEERGDSAEAEQPSCSAELCDTGVGHAGQEETTSGKEPGQVIPVPQEEQGLPQQVEVSAVELEQKQHSHPELACPHEEGSGSSTEGPPDEWELT